MHEHIYRPKYSADFTKWSQHYALIRDTKGKERHEKIHLLQDLIIKNNDASLAYYFASDIGFENYKMQNVIIKAASAQYGILFAINIKNADILALQKMIIEAGEMEYICDFACFVKGAKIKKIEDMILKEGEARWAHKLLKHVKGTSPTKFKNLILKSKKPTYLFELARHLKNKKDLTLIQDLIIESGSPTYIRMFAEKFPSADVEKLEQAILDMENLEETKKFATYVKRSKMRNFVVML